MKKSSNKVITFCMLKNCPKCGESWDGGSIFDSLRIQDWTKDITDEQLQKNIESCYSPPYRWSRLIGIEILGVYDGVSQWMCPFCETKWDRWTGEEIKDKEKKE